MTSFTSLVSFVLLTVHLVNAAVYQDLASLPRNKKYDVIIVGGGTAGPVIASRLTEDRRTRVLLVEAGPDDAGSINLLVPGNYPGFVEPRYNWNLTSTPQSGLLGRTIPYDRGFTLGGSSSTNGMIYTRGAGSDYDKWAEMTGDNGWRWDSLMPLIKRHERFSGAVGGRNITGQYDPSVHGFEGNSKVALPYSGPTEHDLNCLEVTRVNPEFPFNLDMNSGKPLGLGWAQSTFGGGERNSASSAYIPEEVRQRRNLDILVNTRGIRVLPTGPARKKEFRTVELASSADGPRRTLTAEKQVVLSAGVIGTPQILLHSGIGDSADLGPLGIPVTHELKDVGKNLSDHIASVVFGNLNPNVPAPPPVDRDAAMLEWTNSRTGPLTEAVGHQIIWTRLPADSEPLTLHGPDPSSGPDAPHIELIAMNNVGGTMYGGAAVLMTPKSRGTVKLASANAFDAPLIDLGFFTHPFDLAAAKEGIRALYRFYDNPIFDGLKGTPMGPNPDTEAEAWLNWTLQSSSTTLHAVGTASMSRKGAQEGVVDPDLSVKGVKGLSIADASVMPIVPTGHTMAPVYILAERAADLIADRCR